MKYETYIKNISEYIRVRAEWMADTAKEQAAEKSLSEASFFSALKIITNSIWKWKEVAFESKEMLELLDLFGVPKSFVESRKERNAYKIGKAWIEHKSKKEESK